MHPYMDELEREVREVLSKGDLESAVKWVKDKVLQSFRNGLRKRGNGRNRSMQGGKTQQTT